MSEVARIERSARQVWALPGGRHDRLIGVLKWALPMATGVLAAFLVMAPLTTASDVSFLVDKNTVAMARQRLKIQAATYRGEDSKGRPFAISAGSGVQQSSARPVVQLNDLSAQLGMADGQASITAPTGAYDMDAEQVHLNGPVAYRAADGYRLDTSGATVDLKNRTLHSASSVTGSGPQGSFRADRMRADLGTHSVTLDGDVHLRIAPRHAR